MAVEIEAATRQAGEGIGGRDALDLRPVFAAVGVLRIEQPGVEAGLVAEKEEAFGVGVEPAERVDVFWEVEVRERAPTRAGFGRELREDAVGLVKREEQGRDSIAETRESESTETGNAADSGLARMAAVGRFERDERTIPFLCVHHGRRQW